MSESEHHHDVQLGVYGGELGRLVRRLRGLSAAAWRSRLDSVTVAIGGLIDIEAALTDTKARAAPTVPEYALADVVAVIGADVSDALSRHPDGDQLNRALSVVRSALDETK